MILIGLTRNHSVMIQTNRSVLSYAIMLLATSLLRTSLAWEPTLAFAQPRLSKHVATSRGATLLPSSIVRSSPTLPVAATSSSSSSALWMVQNRGLEVRREGATPTEGGMTLYCKAGPDGVSVGDCPFAHFVRMVLEEKGLEYELRPSTQETKPQWLIDYYEGKMPALRHRKECYVESDVIADYLEFFFQEPSLKANSKDEDVANAAIEGIFPAIAKYLKHTPDGDDEDAELRGNLETILARLEAHLKSGDDNSRGPFLVGDGQKMTMLDCSLAPKLYHMQTGIASFKNGAINVKEQFPAVQAYIDAVFARESFQKTLYPKETVEWGWGNARS